MKSRHILRIAFGTVLILLIPLFASLATDEVSWSVGDFVVAFILLFGAGNFYKLGMDHLETRSHKQLFKTLVVFIVILIWAQLAVGIF